MDNIGTEVIHFLGFFLKKMVAQVAIKVQKWDQEGIQHVINQVTYGINMFLGQV
jgi:hypothetical protein